MRALIAAQGKESVPAIAIGSDIKGKSSLALYGAAIPLAFVNPWISFALYVVVEIVWIIPDKRIERALGQGHKSV